jgi:hypothetical protein
MSLTNSFKKIFFITKLDKNRPIKISKRFLNKNIDINQKYNNVHDFSIFDKRRYKKNKDISIYPTPERISNNRLKPLIIKTGAINSNKKNLKPKSQYYLPIMKKIRTDPFETFLIEDAINSSKLKNKSLKIKAIKTDNNSLSNSKNEIEKENGKDKDKDEKKEETMDPGISYSFDRHGNARLKKSSFYFDINDIYNDKQKKENDFSNKTKVKSKSHKEQMLMRNKYQHVKNYYKKIMPILDYDTITNETYKLFDFQPGINYVNTENNDYDIYENKEVVARDLVKEKLPGMKVTGFDKLYMNAMTSIRPYDFDKRK